MADNDPTPLRASGGVIALALAMAFGFGIALFYGRLGFMPAHQSIVFDGGWRILSGQTPYRDFTAPNGVPVFIMQAVFFRLFGVTWFADILHGAVINGLFCAIAYGILREAGATKWIALTYGMLSGLLLYPPIGAPFMEQHAFFFGALALYAAIKGRTAESEKARRVLLALIPPLLAIAFLCKQNSTLVMAPIVFWASISWPNATTSPRASLPWLLAGAGATAVALFMVILIWNMDAEKIFFYFWRLPSKVGQGRLGQLMGPRPYLRTLFDLGAVSPIIVHLAFLGTVLALVEAWISRAAALSERGRARLSATADLILLLSCLLFALLMRGGIRYVLAAAFVWLLCARRSPLSLRGALLSGVHQLCLAGLLTVACIIFILTAWNQIENGVPFLFLSLGLMHAWAHGAVVPRFGKRLVVAISAVFICFALADARLFQRVIASRSVDFISYDAASAKHPHTPALRFMSYQVPPIWEISADDVDGFISFMKEHHGNFLLMGDYSILYGLTDRPSISPSVWFHEGLTFPSRGTREFGEYESALLAACKKYDVRYIVTERTTNADWLSRFPRIVSESQNRLANRYAIGGFAITELGGQW